MAEGADPRGIHEQPAATGGEQLVLTHSLIDFARAELRTYKASVRKGGRLTDERLAQAIRSCPGIDPPDFSAETLRRFLKNEPQQHGDDFLRAIVLFLLHEKWITRADIAARDRDVNMRAAIALQSFLGATPGKKTVEFHMELEGTFVSYSVIPGQFIQTLLYVFRDTDLPCLRVLEEVEHYGTPAAEFILNETNGLSSTFYPKVADLLKTHAQQIGRTRYSSGFGVADAKFISFTLRSELTGDVTAYLVHTLAPDEYPDRFDVMLATRCTGWAMFKGRAEPLCELHRAGSDVATALGIPTRLGWN